MDINWQLLAGIALGLIAIVCFAWAPKEDCPRALLGYRCKGKECDHSPEAIHAARVTRTNNYWGGKHK